MKDKHKARRNIVDKLCTGCRTSHNPDYTTLLIVRNVTTGDILQLIVTRLRSPLERNHTHTRHRFIRDTS